MARAWYGFIRFVVVGFCRLFWRLSVRGREHVPASGPFVLAPVHRSNVDTVFVSTITRRRMRFMGKDSMWKIRFFGAIWTALGAFPVRRGSADREALRRCIEVIEQGEPVVIYPEGTRQTGPEVQPLFEGAAYIATRTGVPIIPVGIGGSEKAMHKGSKLLYTVKVHIVLGPPLLPEVPDEGKRASRRSVRELTDKLHTEVQKLFDEAQSKVS